MNVPALVIFVVKVETAFYEKYTLYVSALNNGTHDLIQKERDVMARALRHQLFFVYEIQLIITVVLVCLVSVFFPYLNASTYMLHIFVILSLGVQRRVYQRPRLSGCDSPWRGGGSPFERFLSPAPAAGRPLRLDHGLPAAAPPDGEAGQLFDVLRR